MLRRLFAIAGMLLPLWAVSASALDPSRTLRQFDHTAWTSRGGAPSHIGALAQTTDGFLWLGTTSGLYRFDGVTFEAYKPVSNQDLFVEDISSLLASPDGGLWIGFRMGGLAFLKHGVVTSYKSGGGTIFSMALQKNGTLWFASFELQRIRPSGQVEPIQHRLHYGGTVATRVFADSSDNVWVGTDTKTYVLRHGQSDFEDTEILSDGNADFSESPDGTVWSLGKDGVLIMPKGPPPMSPARAGNQPASLAAPSIPEGLLADRDGSVWYFVRGHGIYRSTNPMLDIARSRSAQRVAQQHFDCADGLSGGEITASLEDHEGNVWVATSNGLDRFRMTAFALAPLEKYPGEIGMATDTRDCMIVSAWEQGLFRLRSNQLQKLPVPLPNPITSLYRAADGKLWIGGYARLGYFDRGRYTKIVLPKEFEWVPRETQSMTVAANGDLFLSTIARNLYRVRDGVFTEIKLKGVVVPFSLLSDHEGRVWAGYMNNQIRVLRGDSVTSFGPSQGVTVGHVQILYEGKSGIWIAGEHGLNLFQQTHFVNVTFAQAFVPSAVTGIVEGDDGSLWLNTVVGVARISPEEMHAFLSDHAHVVQFTLYNTLDGVSGEAPTFRPLPSALRGGDGRLWFTSDAGASSVDPLHLYRNMVSPPVSIRAVISASQRWTETGRVVLPRGRRTIEIDYSAQSLSVPERVVFRYRLDGVDAAWQDAGTRRQAFYTDVPPGEHRFQVIATNGDGIWNETGASVILVQPPTFVQTVWFKVLCGLLALCVIGLVFLLRMRQMMERFQLRMAERLVERERIARDLHDTLLQGFQGILLRFQIIAQRTSPDDAIRAEMEETAHRADAILADARDKVWQLRTQSAKGTDLAACLRETMHRYSEGKDTAFEMTITGEARALTPDVFEEVCAIAQEGLANAYRHSGASNILIEIAYGDSALCLQVHDNGCGITLEELERNGKDGHWGLVGMRERAIKIGAQFSLKSAVPTGTTIEVCVPATVAYQQAVSAWKTFLKGGTEH